MPSRNRLRRLAAVVLLAWLFGLASGIANACALGGDSPHAAHAAPAAVHVHHAGMSMDSGDCAAPADDAAHGNSPCQTLCDAPPAARSADKELGSLLAGFWLAPAPLPSIGLRMPVAPLAAPAPRAGQARRPGISLPIVFLRLAL
jgi:hypothetical protein